MRGMLLFFLCPLASASEYFESSVERLSDLVDVYAVTLRGKNYIPPWVDIHYRVGDGVQMNYRLVERNGAFSSVVHVPLGSKLFYQFTFALPSGLAQDTDWYSYTEDAFRAGLEQLNDGRLMLVLRSVPELEMFDWVDAHYQLGYGSATPLPQMNVRMMRDSADGRTFSVEIPLGGQQRQQLTYWFTFSLQGWARDTLPVLGATQAPAPLQQLPSQPNPTGQTGLATVASSSVFSYHVQQNSPTSYEVVWAPGAGVDASWVDLHYRVDDGPQLNFRMTKRPDSTWVFRSIALEPPSSLRFSFTNELNGAARNSPWYSWTPADNELPPVTAPRAEDGPEQAPSVDTTFDGRLPNVVANAESQVQHPLTEVEYYDEDTTTDQETQALPPAEMKELPPMLQAPEEPAATAPRQQRQEQEPQEPQQWQQQQEQQASPVIQLGSSQPANALTLPQLPQLPLQGQGPLPPLPDSVLGDQMRMATSIGKCAPRDYGCQLGALCTASVSPLPSRFSSSKPCASSDPTVCASCNAIAACGENALCRAQQLCPLCEAVGFARGGIPLCNLFPCYL